MPPLMIQPNFNTNRRKMKVALTVAVLITVALGLLIGAKAIERDDTLTVWILCRPADYINVRETPSQKGEIVGMLDPCDEITINVNAQNGYFPIVRPTFECGEGYVSCRFISTEKPEWKNGQTYTVVSNSRVAARRWIEGPRVCWLTNGTEVQVFWWTPTWSVTNRGFIRSEFIEEW